MADMVKVTLHWSGLGEEGVVQWNAQLGTAGGLSPAQLDAILAAVDTAFTSGTTPSTWTDLSSLLPSSQTFDKLTAYYYADAAGPASAVTTRAVTHVGSATANLHPLQVALVNSVHTAASGASHRGRQFWPAQGLPVVVGTMLLASGTVDAAAQKVANAWTFVENSVRSTYGDPARLGVYSPTKHVFTPATSLSVDNKLDTQRRRERSLKAQYVKTTTLSH